MNDRALKVLEQYELDIISTRRGRGSYILETSQGLRILSDYTGSEHKALFQNCVMDRVRAGGYGKVDRILPNKEGGLISKDWEENKYVVKEWYTGRECDTTSESEIMAAVSNLARLHRLMHLSRENVKADFRYRDFAAACVNRETASADCETSGSQENPNTMMTGEMILNTMDTLYEKFRQNFTAPMPLDEIRSQNAELKKIRSFIRKKNTKGDFERLFLNCFEQYFEQAREAELKLQGQTFSAPGQSGSVCHGDYNHHHILMSGYDMATTNFECCRFDFQVSDLYRFLRKILEKHDWNPRLGMRMLENYTQVRPLSAQERKLLYVRMLYPEKFRKLANYYYGSNKAWISRRYMDKLEKLNRQEVNKNQFVKLLER